MALSLPQGARLHQVPHVEPSHANLRESGGTHGVYGKYVQLVGQAERCISGQDRCLTPRPALQKVPARRTKPILIVNLRVSRVNVRAR